MSNPAYFVQECPTCGRRLHIRVEYLGKKVVCQHCHGEFEARDPVSSSYPYAESCNTLLQRADELLQSASQVNLRSRTPHPR